MQEINYKLNKLQYLVDKKNKQKIIKKLYYTILTSTLFGILIPLACIITLPNNTYFISVGYDLSNIVAAALSFISLLPYAVIISRSHSFLKTK